MAQLSIENGTITATFHAPFDMASYDTFIQSKKLPECNLAYRWETDTYELTAPARFAGVFGLKDPGLDHGWLTLPAYLFDYERFIVRQALEAKRFAIWADTGLGKTAMGLEFCRQVMHRTRGRVLMIVPLNIIPQTIDEAAKFYGAELEIRRINHRSEIAPWCSGSGPGIAIVNPDKFIPRKDQAETISEVQYLAGVWLDESSLLKAGGGTIKWALIKSCRGIEYKLSTTATPAPNDTMEYASQGSFLEKLRHEGEILWTFFCRDKFGNWKVKDHAKEGFYRFMSGWSVYLRSPKNYGFADNLKDLPKPIITEYEIAPTQEQRALVQAVPDATGQLPVFGKGDCGKLGITERSQYSQIAKGFRYEGKSRKPTRYPSLKPAFVADLVRKDFADGLQIIVWTVFDEESAILSEILADVPHETLSGSVPKKDRPDMIERFRKGETRVLISKAALLGFGLNFQNCGSMVFSGFNDSFEQLYQAVRRAYRYGQTKTVRVHIPYIPELEGVIWRNVMKKQEKFNEDCSVQERNYLEAMKEVLRHAAR